MPSKQASKQRALGGILIYIILAFVPAYAICLGFSDGQGGVKNEFWGSTVMLYPAIAAFITRLVTKEGFRSAKLGTGRKGSAKYYLAAVLYPLALPFVSALILHLFIVKNGSISDSAFADSGTAAASTLLFAFASGIAMALHGFGEEFGWRAYLTPKLEELMPTPAAIVVTGIIWALWHGPLLAYGYNFGRDYGFFPYGGFIAMIVMCIFWSALLTWMTKRTDSVYPAAICHILIDTVLTGVYMLFKLKADGTPFECRLSEFWTVILSVFPMIIVSGSAAMVLLCKSRKGAAAQ